VQAAGFDAIGGCRAVRHLECFRSATHRHHDAVCQGASEKVFAEQTVDRNFAVQEGNREGLAQNNAPGFFAKTCNAQTTNASGMDPGLWLFQHIPGVVAPSDHAEEA
jgi:hypothetical protein